MSRPARSLALPGRAAPGSGSILGPKSSAALNRNLVRCLPGTCISQGISHDLPLPGQILLLVTGLVEYLETQLAATSRKEWLQAEVWTRLQSWGSSALPPLRKCGSLGLRAAASQALSQSTESSLKGPKSSALWRVTQWAKGTGKQEASASSRHELQAPHDSSHMPLLCPEDPPQASLRTGPSLNLPTGVF